MSIEKLDAETERRLSLVLQKYYGRGVERCGCDEQDLAAVDALRSRIKELIEEARKEGVAKACEELTRNAPRQPLTRSEKIGGHER